MQTQQTQQTTQKTIKDPLRDFDFTKGKNISYEPFDVEQTKLFIMFTMSNNEDNDKSFIKELLSSDEYNNQFLTQILKKRIEVFNLQDKIDDEALAMYLCFNICSPGAAIIYLIDLLEFYETKGRKATIGDISNIYPMGFYDENSLLFIIDNITKPKLSIWSQIY